MVDKLRLTTTRSDARSDARIEGLQIHRAHADELGDNHALNGAMLLTGRVLLSTMFATTNKDLLRGVARHGATADGCVATS